jgi:hypothetical protein
MALGAAACLGETTLVTPPKAPATTITLTFKADSEDAATAASLGWADGIPDVAATVTPEDSTLGPPQQVQGSASGTVTLHQLGPGRYVVDAVRWLTDEERASLPAGDDAVGFVTRVHLNTGAPAADLGVPMVASRQHGVLISEWKDDPLFTPSEGTYFYSGYLRLYNNGKTTIYLDGLLIGRALDRQFDYGQGYGCSFWAPWALDPQGVWALNLFQLPGPGNDYPLPPGGTAVLATDAIDHRPLFSEGLDLRSADFEFYGGGGDVDNPAVPNAEDVGVNHDPVGHGLLFTGLGRVAFVARPFDLASALVETAGDVRLERIPASDLLDVMAMKTTYQAAYPECPQLVYPSFDREAARLLGGRPEDDLLAYRRRTLPFTIGGQVVEQYTRTSAWDFGVAPRSPFAKP